MFSCVYHGGGVCEWFRGVVNRIGAKGMWIGKGQRGPKGGHRQKRLEIVPCVPNKEKKRENQTTTILRYMFNSFLLVCFIILQTHICTHTWTDTPAHQDNHIPHDRGVGPSSDPASPTPSGTGSNGNCGGTKRAIPNPLAALACSSRAWACGRAVVWVLWCGLGVAGQESSWIDLPPPVLTPMYPALHIYTHNPRTHPPPAATARAAGAGAHTAPLPACSQSRRPRPRPR